jgi:hypothetical protein
VPLHWAHQDYVVPVPADASLPAFLVLEELAAPRSGQIVLVLRRKPGVLGLLRGAAPAYRAIVRVGPCSGYFPGAPPERGPA